MRHAPPVGVTSSGAGGWRRAQALLAGAAAAAVAGWAGLQLDAPRGAAAAAIVAALLAAVVAGMATRPRSASLHWDGAAWKLDGDTGGIELMLDLGGWLLLRFRRDGARPRWLAVTARESGASWHGLRAALYARTLPEPR